MTEDNPNIEEQCNLTLPGEEEEDLQRRAFRLKVGTDVEVLGEIDDEQTDDLAEQFEVLLNDWFGYETPSGVEVEIERLE